MTSDPRTALAEQSATDGLRGWRWFIDGDWIVFEPPGRSEIHLSEMKLVASWRGVANVGAVFRATPHTGVYLRFRLQPADDHRFPIIVGQSHLPLKIRQETVKTDVVRGQTMSDAPSREHRWMAPHGSAHPAVERNGEAMQLIWYQRGDGLWNATCSCNASVVGVPFERRADAEQAHFDLTAMEREFRAKHPERFAGNQIPACGAKLPEQNPNLPGPLVFP